MAVDVFVPADCVWGFFHSKLEQMKKEMVAIAENKETGYTIYLTEGSGFPVLSVCKGDAPPEYEELTPTQEDCLEAVKRLYVRFLLPTTVEYDSAPKEEVDDCYDDDLYELREMEMFQRDAILQAAMSDLLDVVLYYDDPNASTLADLGADFIEEVLSTFLQYLADDHGFEVYRPMYVESEDGCETYSEFPYNDFIIAETKTENEHEGGCVQ